MTETGLRADKNRRQERRRIVDKFFSVELHVRELTVTYQFKIWNISSSGMCILVRKDSEICQYLHVGDVLNMKYYEVDTPARWEKLNTQIMHISENRDGSFSGHYMVGLYVLSSGQATETTGRDPCV